MKLIFLDIDGVLNNDRTNTKTPDGYIGISDSLGKRLERIIKATDASVVLTSTWKDVSSPEDKAYMMKKLRRYKAIPVGEIHEPHRSLRGTGIKRYLEMNVCDEYVILDDFSFDFEQEGLTEHAVITHEWEGLTDEDVEKAIRILNGDLSANSYTKVDDWGYHKI